MKLYNTFLTQVCPYCTMEFIVHPEEKSLPSKHYFRDGNVVLYKRDESRYWQARFKLADMKWHRISTGQATLKIASEIACEKYDEARYRHKFELPQVTKRFNDVALMAIEEMELALKTGQGKSVYRTYISAIKTHLIPYFGRKNIDKITLEDHANFVKHRETQLGKKIQSSTLTNYNTSIYRIYDIALNKGWITKPQYPELKNRGLPSNRRPTFTPDEWKIVYRELRKFSKTGHTLKTRQMRELLRDQVLILGNTGMRYGTETENLRWKHVFWHTNNDGTRYLMMDVKGKYKVRRELVCRHSVETYLKRIQSRFPELSQYSFDELLDKKLDIPVFRLASGEVTERLDQSFRQFLNECKLLKDIHGKNRTLYSLRHMYATFALVKGDVNVHDLASQMGTSIGMIEKHYSHLKPAMRAKLLAGEPLPSSKPKST